MSALAHPAVGLVAPRGAAGLLAQLSVRQATGFILVLGRVGPLFVLAPLFSSRMLPPRARVVAAVGIAFGLAPLALHGGGGVPDDVMGLVALILKEVLVGFAFAFAVGVVFSAISVAGSFLDTLIGFSYGSLIDPVTGNNSSILAQLYGLVGVMIFIGIGGDALMVQGLARTYQLVPLLQYPSLGALTAGVQHAFTGIFGSALELAAPVILALIITDAAFGVLSRVVPQLNVFAVGFPAKITVGLVIIAASMPFAGGFIADRMNDGIGGALSFLRAV